MWIATSVVVGLIGLLHLGFLFLEMFLWEKPTGRKIFRLSPEKAQITAPLAANQGLYNGFLAGGLLLSLGIGNPEFRFLSQDYFVACVILAGVYGAKTVSRRIFWIQAFPALIAAALLLWERSSTFS